MGGFGIFLLGIGCIVLVVHWLFSGRWDSNFAFWPLFVGLIWLMYSIAKDVWIYFVRWLKYGAGRIKDMLSRS